MKDNCFTSLSNVSSLCLVYLNVDDRSFPSENRSLFLFSDIINIFEAIINKIVHHFSSEKHVLSEKQHGFQSAQKYLLFLSITRLTKIWLKKNDAAINKESSLLKRQMLECDLITRSSITCLQRFTFLGRSSGINMWYIIKIKKTITNNKK